jgi:hypothetical protein
LIGAAFAVGLVGAASAFAVTQGAVKAPRSGNAFTFANTAGGSQLNVEFTGTKRDAATQVRVRIGHIDPNGEVNQPIAIRYVSTFTCAAGAARWPAPRLSLALWTSRSGATTRFRL